MISMKNLAVSLGLFFAAGSTLAQQPAPTTVQMQCHDLASTGNVLGPDETLVNGMACRLVKVNPPTPQSAPAKSEPAAQSGDQAPNAPATPAVPPTAPPLGAVTAPANTRIVPGATVFIAPMDGFENYLAAALQKKNVPLVPVANESQATYVIKGTADEKKAGWAKIAFTGQIHSDDAASVQMFDRQSGAIVFAYAVDKKNTIHGRQTTAEACAKHLKEQIEKK
jgi:hypothetical protein